MSEESRYIGFTALLVRACFHARDDNSLSGRSPEQFAQDHSLVLGLLFRVPSLSSPALTPFGRGPYCQGLCPLRDITGCVHSSRGHPKSSIRSVRRCSQPLDGFLRIRLSGLFHPAAASRTIRSFRGFPSPRSDRVLVGTICPLAVAITYRSPGRILTATVGTLGFEALIRAGARAPRGW